MLGWQVMDFSFSFPLETNFLRVSRLYRAADAAAYPRAPTRGPRGEPLKALVKAASNCVLGTPSEVLKGTLERTPELVPMGALVSASWEDAESRWNPCARDSPSKPLKSRLMIAVKIKRRKFTSFFIS